jgi:hypothetical protein
MERIRMRRGPISRAVRAQASETSLLFPKLWSLFMIIGEIVGSYLIHMILFTPTRPAGVSVLRVSMRNYYRYWLTGIHAPAGPTPVLLACSSVHL